jgi:hypothetical protein
MAVYLGNSGLVAIQRTGSGSYTSILDVADVNVAQRRFSFDFPNTTFITGDRLQITRVGGGDLDFIDASGFTPAVVASTGFWYVHVDPIGGIRLYKEWADSITGEASKAVILAAPSTNYTISVEISEGGFRTLGEVTNYELSTVRSAVDVTALGDLFAEQVSTTISGSGSITCFWDWDNNGSDLELAQYMHQLILRQQLGSNFTAALTLKRLDESAATGPRANDGFRLYYLINALVTNIGIAFEPSEPMRSQIEFVTTGEIQMRYSESAAQVGALLLQENGGHLLLESGAGSLLQEEP